MPRTFDSAERMVPGEIRLPCTFDEVESSDRPATTSSPLAVIQPRSPVRQYAPEELTLCPPPSQTSCGIHSSPQMYTTPARFASRLS